MNRSILILPGVTGFSQGRFPWPWIKMPEISVGTSNGTDNFGLVRPEFSGPWALSIQPKSPEFRLVHQMERTISVWSDRNIWDQLWRWSTVIGLVISVDRNVPFQFDKIVVPSTSFLFPAYENNNQTHGGLGWVCATGMYHSIGHMKFLKFQTRFFPLTFPISLSVQDQLRFLGDWPPTPPLSQSFSLRNE